MSARDDYRSLAHHAGTVGTDEWDRHDEECVAALNEIDRLRSENEQLRGEVNFLAGRVGHAD